MSPVNHLSAPYMSADQGGCQRTQDRGRGRYSSWLAHCAGPFTVRAAWQEPPGAHRGMAWPPRRSWGDRNRLGKVADDVDRLAPRVGGRVDRGDRAYVVGGVDGLPVRGDRDLEEAGDVDGFAGGAG